MQTKRRVCLTGYPLQVYLIFIFFFSLVQNNLKEYWCMINFAYPNFLGNMQEFEMNFEKPIRDGLMKGVTEYVRE